MLYLELTISLTSLIFFIKIKLIAFYVVHSIENYFFILKTQFIFQVAKRNKNMKK